ncbi:MAG: hypothetical protein CL526_09325 [Aequorivita sp.]|nr:hypothetical protein [Aequorivita sp.]|tara:strand:- start:44 stop:580 length:537 start_codon:yes stop_codon:yes gene_type:complete
MKFLHFTTILTLFAFLFIPPTVHSQDNATLSDAEIAHVAVVANQIDIDYAKIAIERTQSKEVRQFAQTMITDHNTIINLAVDLVKKLGVTPQDNAVSQSLLNKAADTMESLKNAKKSEFNQMYVDNEVAYHKAVIDAIKTVLIPQSKNAELKALLKTAVPILETHYHHAKMTQSKISK